MTGGRQEVLVRELKARIGCRLPVSCRALFRLECKLKPLGSPSSVILPPVPVKYAACPC
jgi:hypothetical protein